METTTQAKTKTFPGGETTATMVHTGYGFWKVTVIHRFDSGNYMMDSIHLDCSKVSALGLLEFYTR